MEVALVSLHRALSGCLFSVSTEHRNISKKGVLGEEGFDGKEIGIFAVWMQANSKMEILFETMLAVPVSC